MKVTVYKASTREYLYVYVSEAFGLEKVPTALLAQFGEPSVVMTLDLEAGQKLARVCAEEVMAAVQNKKYKDMICRFDVVAIQGEKHNAKINWIKNAFY